MNKVFIVTAHDFHFQRCENVRLIKTFSNFREADEFKVTMIMKLNEWKQRRPKLDGLNGGSEQEWAEYYAQHPYAFPDGFEASEFSIIEMEVE